MDHEPGVRVYGATLGHASAAQVTTGVVAGLEACGAFAGLVPVDQFDEDAYYDGALAEQAVLVGPPSNMNLLMRGYHARRHVLIAPNSTWIPDGIVDAVAGRFHLVSPSEWGAAVLRRYFADSQVTVWQHGVLDGFRIIARYHDDLVSDYRSGLFRVLHLTSSERQRKGTIELLKAWNLLTALADAECLLTVVAETGRHAEDLRQKAKSFCAEDNVEVRDRLDLPVNGMAKLYQSHHVVCQPSRGEGFGLVPLEARACGVPVVMTSCTGHSEHARLTDNGVAYGVVDVPVGELQPVDDGPGAEAPSVDPVRLGDSLATSYADWQKLHREAVDLAWFVHQDWSWPAVTRRWLRKVGIDG